MLNSAIVQMTPSCIRLKEAALEPFGIADGSSCWGVKIEDSSKDSKKEHFVISTMHPHCWPYLVRLRVYTSTDRRALTHVSRVVKESGFNIHFSEYSPCGFRHYVWYAIAECMRDKDGMRGQNAALNEYPLLGGLEEARRAKTMKDLCRHMVTRAELLRLDMFSEDHALRVANAAEERSEGGRGRAEETPKQSEKMDARERVAKAEGFLRRRIRDPVFAMLAYEGEESPGFDPKAIMKHVFAEVRGDLSKTVTKRTEGADPDLVEELASDALFRRFLSKSKGNKAKSHAERCESALSRNHFPSCVVSSWMSRMACYAIHAAQDSLASPLEFRYDRQRAALTLLRGRPLYSGSEAPALAQVSFHQRDKYLRVERIEAETPITIVNARYTVPETSECVGLLHNSAKKVADSGGETLLHHIRSGSNHAEETGNIHFQVRGDRGSEQEIDLSCIHDSIDAARSSTRRRRPETIFLSMRMPKSHEDRHRTSRIEKAVRAAALELGVAIRMSSEKSQAVTETVDRNIKECSHFLVVLHLLDRDDPQKVSTPWLNFEYGVAFSLGMRIGRAAEKRGSGINLKHLWKESLPLHQDTPVTEFDLSHDDEKLVSDFRGAIEDLVNGDDRVRE